MNEAKKLTLRHGHIENFGMPPMTMVFQVKDPAMVGIVNVGDSGERMKSPPLLI
jgi:Cu/Ag efflux protein CusF